MSDAIAAFLARTVAGNTVETWCVVLLIIVLGRLIGRMCHFVLTRWVLRITARTGTAIDDKLIGRTARPFSLVVMFAIAHFAVRLLVLPAQVLRAVDGAILVAIALLGAVILMRAVDVAFEEWAEPWARRREPPINVQALHVGRIFAKVVAGSFVMVGVLQRAGFDVWSVVTGLGIGGVAVALAAQQTLGNLFGSLQVMTDQPFKVGDWIRVDQNFGRVTHVGLRSTRLQTSAGQTFIIPNKHIAEATIENAIAPQGQVRELFLGLTYNTSADRLEHACALVRAVLAAERGVHPEFLVHVFAFAESSVQIRVIYRVPDIAAFAAIGHNVNLAIKRAFDDEGLTFAFPTRTVHVVRARGAGLPELGSPSEGARTSGRREAVEVAGEPRATQQPEETPPIATPR